MTHKIGDRVVLDHPRYETLPGQPEDRDHGRTGTVTRTPGMEATPGLGLGPSGSYAVRFDGSPYPRAPIAPEHLRSAD